MNLIKVESKLSTFYYIKFSLNLLAIPFTEMFGTEPHCDIRIEVFISHQQINVN